MFLILSCLLLLSSPVVGQEVAPLTYQDCAGNVICLVQKHCIYPESTEFRTLIRWRSQFPKVVLSDCNGIRFSGISLRYYSGIEVFGLRVQMQIGRDKSDQSPFKVTFAHDYTLVPFLEFGDATVKLSDGTVFKTFETLIFPGIDIGRKSDADAGSSINEVNKVFVYDVTIAMQFNKTQPRPFFRTRMRLITDAEVFTYEDDDFWDIFDAMTKKEVAEPLTTQYIQYCILILLVYSITVYFLDQYCRRLQYTTMNRVELEEYFFPPARYRTNLDDFHMLRRPTKIEKEKNISAVVPEDILVDFEN